MLLGTRIFYPFHDAHSLADDAFETRVDAVCREIGERGRQGGAGDGAVIPSSKSGARMWAPQATRVDDDDALTEGVPPPLSTHTPKQQQEEADGSASGLSFTPSMIELPPAGLPRQSPCAQEAETELMVAAPGGGAERVSPSSAGVGEILAFMKEQQALLFEREAQTEAKVEARLKVQREHDDQIRRQIREEIEAKLAPAQSALSDEQLSMLQHRLEALHVAKLLEDEELFTLEVRTLFRHQDSRTIAQRGAGARRVVGRRVDVDVRACVACLLAGFSAQDLIADVIELQFVAGQLTMEATHTNRSVAQVCKMVALCEKMDVDRAFARQLRRKFF